MTTYYFYELFKEKFPNIVYDYSKEKHDAYKNDVGNFLYTYQEDKEENEFTNREIRMREYQNVKVQHSEDKIPLSNQQMNAYGFVSRYSDNARMQTSKAVDEIVMANNIWGKLSNRRINRKK